MTPTQAMALHQRLLDAFPTQRALFLGNAAAEWRSWLEALPHAEAARAVTVLVAGSSWPTISQLLGACGFDCAPDKPGGPIRLTPAVNVLIAAREAGDEVVRDPSNPHGWRCSRDALPAARTAEVPCPPEVRAEIRRMLGALASKRVPARAAAT